ncbi:hypothetical protein QE152_g13356 [Popillia japonica]|uniref:Uncharacterized protein n=1 Tax=Popillia japonica TaxID=7064 RepID=A0AAW1LDQ2_POPJA
MNNAQLTLLHPYPYIYHAELTVTHTLESNIICIMNAGASCGHGDHQQYLTLRILLTSDGPDFERTDLKWSEECDDEYSDGEEVDEDYWEMSEHGSNSDEETNEVELDKIIQDEDAEESEIQEEGVSENI